jgi:hypothetical protein
LNRDPRRVADCWKLILSVEDRFEEDPDQIAADCGRVEEVTFADVLEPNTIWAAGICMLVPSRVTKASLPIVPKVG